MENTVDDERLARTALSLLVEPGSQILHALVQGDGPARTLRRLVSGGLPAGALNDAASARLRAGDPWEAARAALARADRLGARIIIPDDEEWPARLFDLVRISRPGSGKPVDRDTLPPLCLWVRGPLPLAETLERSVAVVGSRAATPYGVHVAAELGQELAERGWCVVSGGAFGIDAAAHRGALTGGGATIAVLASGLDRPYPAGNTSLFDQIGEHGLLLSEWPPETAPFRHRFLIRNRVIAAATRGTILVEAAIRSGARQTLGRALMLGRPAMVVPGPITSAMSVGCHEMLREHPELRLVTSAEQVLEEVGRIGDDLAPQARGPQLPRDSLDPLAGAVLEAVPKRRIAGVEEIAAAAGVGLRDVIRTLPLLTELGFVLERDGGYRIPPPPRITRPPRIAPPPGTAPPAPLSPESPRPPHPPHRHPPGTATRPRTDPAAATGRPARSAGPPGGSAGRPEIAHGPRGDQ